MIAGRVVDRERPSVGGISSTSISSMHLKKNTDNLKESTSTEVTALKGSFSGTTQGGSTDDEAKGIYLFINILYYIYFFIY